INTIANFIGLSYYLYGRNRVCPQLAQEKGSIKLPLSFITTIITITAILLLLLVSVTSTGRNRVRPQLVRTTKCTNPNIWDLINSARRRRNPFENPLRLFFVFSLKFFPLRPPCPGAAAVPTVRACETHSSPAPSWHQVRMAAAAAHTHGHTHTQHTQHTHT